MNHTFLTSFHCTRRDLFSSPGFLLTDKAPRPSKSNPHKPVITLLADNNDGNNSNHNNNSDNISNNSDKNNNSYVER